MFGTYSTALTNRPDSFSDGASVTRSTGRCNLHQLVRSKNSETSMGNIKLQFVIDRETGKTITGQSPSFDFTMSSSSLSLKANWQEELPQNKLIAMIKCLSIIQFLSQEALEEAAIQLKEIAEFYSDRDPQTILPVIPASSIRGLLRATEVRPPIVFEP